MIVNSAADDIKDILITDNPVVYIFGTNLFVGHIPEYPDKCVVILDSGGFDSDVNSDYERPSVQIRSRNNVSQYLQARKDIADIVTILHGKRKKINNIEYTFIKQGDITYVGRDDNDRVEMVCEIITSRVPIT